MNDVTTATSERPVWTRAQVRARDLCDGDVIRHDGQWRVLMDVWKDDDLDQAVAMYPAEFAPEQRALIVDHLMGLAAYVVVRMVEERPGEHEHFQTTRPLPLRAFDLVDIQVEQGSAPTPPRAPVGD